MSVSTLLQFARLAQAKAYAPYSTFHVGACIRTSQDNYYKGCNIENASYGLTMCAENTAIGNMIVQGEQSIAEVLIIGSSNEFCIPCGRCLQLFSEFANPHIAIHLCNHQEQFKTLTLAELLPHPFLFKGH